MNSACHEQRRALEEGKRKEIAATLLRYVRKGDFYKITLMCLLDISGKNY
jgi:hypothetical protein